MKNHLANSKPNFENNGVRNLLIFIVFYFPISKKNYNIKLYLKFRSIFNNLLIPNRHSKQCLAANIAPKIMKL